MELKVLKTELTDGNIHKQMAADYIPQLLNDFCPGSTVHITHENGNAIAYAGIVLDGNLCRLYVFDVKLEKCFRSVVQFGNTKLDLEEKVSKKRINVDPYVNEFLTGMYGKLYN